MARTLIWNISKETQAAAGYLAAGESLNVAQGVVVAEDILTVLAALGGFAGMQGKLSAVPVSDSAEPGLRYDVGRFDGGSSGAGYAQWPNIIGKPSFATNVTDLGEPAAGNGLAFASGDHVHGHGNLAGGTLHDPATSSVAGFMSVADKNRLDLIQRAATGNQPAGALPVALGTASWGTSDYYAAADHTHPHGNLGDGAMHAVATSAAAGFLSAADKANLDSFLGRYDIMVTKEGPIGIGELVSRVYVPRKMKFQGVVGGDVTVVREDTLSPVLVDQVVPPNSVLRLTANTDISSFVGAIKAVEVP